MTEQTEKFWTKVIFGFFVVLICVITTKALLVESGAAQPKRAPTIQWIGKLTASDGASRPFTMNNVEIGLANDGTLHWRQVQPPQLLSKPEKE